jgi:DNA-binding transcriptional LysR family regulator
MTSDSLAPPALRYFVAIAEAGSFTAAARALRVSQPSLTVAIRKLEEELGTSLFLRTSRGVCTTRAGTAFLHHAKRILHSLSDARTEIEGLESEPRGRFTIGCHESLGAYFLPGFMGPFLHQHPAIELTLWNGNSRDVQEAVIQRAVDVGVVVNAAPHPECVVQPLFADRVQFIVTGELRRRARRKPLGLLENHALLYVPALTQVQYLLGALEQAGIRSTRHIACSSMELVKSLVLDGAGIGILPHRVASHRVPEGSLVALSSELPSFEDQIALVRRFDLHVTAAAKLLLTAIRQHGRTLA